MVRRGSDFMIDSSARCIGVDWGSSRFRAYLLNSAGDILDRRISDVGVARVAAGDFERTLFREIGSWLDAFPEAHVLASGMVGSRQGWLQTRYLECPVDLSALTAKLERREIGGRCIAFTPGLTRVATDGVPDVMRGEEVQVLGSLEQLGEAGWCVLPGTHCKWVRVEGKKIVWFASFMSGELFDVLVRHSLLTRGQEASEASGSAAFERGLDYARGTDPESGGFLKRLFSTRRLVARGELSGPEAREYLSGLIIGSELREALTSLPGARPRRVMLIGASELVRRYAAAFARLDIDTFEGSVDAAAHGHFSIARQAGLA
jgi:2-dehydro-3-deoxygalactonokinase